MAVYIVTYDLNKETKRPNITKRLKDTYAWARLSESSYAIDTNDSPTTVRENFADLLDDNDDFYVISLKRPWDGYGSKTVIDWLSVRLGT